MLVFKWWKLQLIIFFCPVTIQASVLGFCMLIFTFKFLCRVTCYNWRQTIRTVHFIITYVQQGGCFTKKHFPQMSVTDYSCTLHHLSSYISSILNCNEAWGRVKQVSFLKSWKVVNFSTEILYRERLSSVVVGHMIINPYIYICTCRPKLVTWCFI